MVVLGTATVASGWLCPWGPAIDGPSTEGAAPVLSASGTETSAAAGAGGVVLPGMYEVMLRPSPDEPPGLGEGCP